MRSLMDHIVAGDNPERQVSVNVLDEPGQGGACHKYVIAWSGKSGTGLHATGVTNIDFQNGPIKEVGLNGVTHESMLAILIDRLRSFQKGPYACSENEMALSYGCLMLSCLQARTRARIARGVEGTHEK